MTFVRKRLTTKITKHFAIISINFGDRWKSRQDIILLGMQSFFERDTTGRLRRSDSVYKDRAKHWPSLDSRCNVIGAAQRLRGVPRERDTSRLRGAGCLSLGCATRAGFNHSSAPGPDGRERTGANRAYLAGQSCLAEFVRVLSRPVARPTALPELWGSFQARFGWPGKDFTGWCEA